jgi:hypothetical protein
MLRILTRAWATYQAELEAKRRARERAFLAAVLNDCFDPIRQAERLARFQRMNTL